MFSHFQSNKIKQIILLQQCELRTHCVGISPASSDLYQTTRDMRTGLNDCSYSVWFAWWGGG